MFGDLPHQCAVETDFFTTAVTQHARRNLASFVKHQRLYVTVQFFNPGFLDLGVDRIGVRSFHGGSSKRLKFLITCVHEVYMQLKGFQRTPLSKK